MSMKTFLLGAIAATTFSFTTTAMADYEYASGAYLGIQGGYAHTNWCDAEDCMRKLGYFTQDIDDDSYGARIFLGYDFNANFAAELGYLYVSDQIDWSFARITPRFKGCIGHRAYDAVLKMRIYLETGFAVYTKLGVAYMEACDAFTFTSPTVLKHDTSNTNVTFGAGMQYCITPNFIANLDWQQYRGCADCDSYLADLNFFSFGLAYKFIV